jgi:hypothetical protein
MQKMNQKEMNTVANGSPWKLLGTEVAREGEAYLLELQDLKVGLMQFV